MSHVRCYLSLFSLKKKHLFVLILLQYLIDPVKLGLSYKQWCCFLVIIIILHTFDSICLSPTAKKDHQVFPKTLQARNYLHSHQDVCRTSIYTLAMFIWDMYVSKIATLCLTDEIDSDNSFIIIQKD